MVAFDAGGFKEEDHPRDAGKFASKEGGASAPDIGKQLVGLARLALEKGNENPVVEFGTVSAQAAALAKEKADIDIAGFTHSADMYSMRHLLKTHGDAKSEAKRGQLAITEKDVASIPDVVSNPDTVVYGGKSRVGRDTIASIKQLDDGTVLVAEEIRTGKKRLALVSMRKYPATKDAPSVARTVSLNVQNDSQALDAIVVDCRLGASGMDSARVDDVNGFTEIRGNPLSKVGVFPYSGRSIPDAPEPDRAYMVYRPPEELADPECINSFKLLPWIDNHVMLGSEEDGLMPAEKKGVQGVIGEEVYFEGETLFGNLKVFSQSLANLIEAGKRELSCGYRCVYEWTSGVFNGQAYEVIQRRIRGNHLALVESGRMGPDVAVLDGSALDHFVFTLDSKEIAMAEEKKDGEAGGMTLEDAIKAIEGLMPAIKMLQDAAAGKAADPEPTPDPVEDPAATDAGPEKKDEPKDEPKADPEKKDGSGMDAAPTFKKFVAQIAARDRIAEQLSWHVGAFDHAEMSAEDVASYGIKKLKLSSPKGQESAVLAGYLQGKGDPRKEARAQVAAMDSSGGDNFVNRHLNKGQ